MGDAVENLWKAVGLTVQLIAHVVWGSIRAVLPWSWLPHKDVDNKVVLITGAGSGLGRRLAILFAEKGSQLVLWDVNETLNKETETLVNNIGKKNAKAYTINITNRKAVYEVAEQVKKDFGHVDILVNNAGVVNGKPFLECPDELIERTVQVNTLSLFWVTKAFLADMVSRDDGHIVVVASMAGKVGVAGQVDYAVSKFGAVGFAESLRSELRENSENLHVTTICPYYIDTGMFHGVKTSSPILLPILSTNDAADLVLHATLTNQAVLQTPKFTYVTMILSVLLPTPAKDAIAKFFNINQEMKAFKGRQ